VAVVSAVTAIEWGGISAKIDAMHVDGNMGAPLVSILIPCFNAERWIGQAIDSALKQAAAGCEVIVVDDGSSDESLGIIRGYGDRIRYENGPNRGGNWARNRLLELAKGEWLQYLDADDYLMPDKIARQFAFLASGHADADVIYGPVTVEHWSESGSEWAELPIPEPHDEWVLLARWFLPQTGAPLWRKSALVDVGGWKADQPCCQEHELYLRLLMAGKRFVYCEAGGAVYRQWSDQTLCRRDVPEVNRRRLEIKRRAQEFLATRGKLTAARLAALSVARFEIARNAWSYDRGLAIDIMQHVRRDEPAFVPAGTTAAPPIYQLAFRLLGFERAQRLADRVRGLPRWS
jgi:glycosyltransferase involved in cell wall biosynthesis